MPVYYIERKTGDLLEEKVTGEKLMHWLYETKTGNFALGSLVRKKAFSYWYGKVQDSAFSKRKIERFIKDFRIDLSEALIDDCSAYSSFNDFFTRKLKPQSRPIAADQGVLTSPADGRLSAWENIDINHLLQIKGFPYTLTGLIQDPDLAAEFSGGDCIVARLSPADYHRFHFPDSGMPEAAQKITGRYYSVNPYALGKIPKLYCQNKRELTIFHSENFGKMLLVEVGATCVGAIVQTYSPECHVNKGSEKGYFKFGGSTVILFFAPNKVKIDDDLLTNTQKKIETKVCMGEKIGIAKSYFFP
jgi:phosphatidylserine decarboxylase